MIYTSAQILAQEDLYDLQEVLSGGRSFKYQLTDAEMGWLAFVRGRYSIADWIDARIDSWAVLTIDDSFSEALDSDCEGAGKAVCLDDNTALQRIFFWGYTPQE